MKPLFITFEGPDKAGKTTQIALFCQALRDRGVDFIQTREPGGCPVCEKIRAVILDKDNEMGAVCEALLYAASRAELVERVIAPALRAGRWVICDRFVDSSIAYQGYGRGLGYDTVAAVNAIAVAGNVPDFTFYLDIDPRQSMKRAAEGEKDRLEQEPDAFFLRTVEGYWEVASRAADRVAVIDASGTIEEVHQRIMDAFARRVSP